jgi:hypothetical protein
VHGQRAAVVVSAKAFDALTMPPLAFVDFLLGDDPWPDDVVEAINDRGTDPGRDVAF